MGLADLDALVDRPRMVVTVGPTRKRLKGRRDRAEAAVKRTVRAACVERDGECRIGDWERNPDDWHADDLEGCDGPSEWAHLVKRSQTRNMRPELRHNTRITLMLCHRHHAAHETGRLGIVAFDSVLGADGPLSMDAPQ